MNKITQLIQSISKTPASSYPRDKGIYLHCRASDKIPMYVGIGGEGRPEQVGKAQRNADWHEVYEKHGRTVEMLYTKLTEWQAKTIEVALIFVYRHIYGKYREGGYITNRSDGGEGCSGYKFTEEQLKNRSATNSRPEVKAKKSDSNKIAHKRPEVKAKHSAALTGELNPMYGKFGEQHPNFQGYSVGINEEQFVILGGLKEIKECGFDRGSISKCILGRPKYNSHKGFRWTRSSTLNPDDFAGLEPFNELSAERIKK
jgi:hypothetical protein